MPRIVEPAVYGPWTELSRPAQRLLLMARRAIGGFMTLHRAQAVTAQALERKGLGMYHRTDDALTFKLTETGRRAADWLSAR